MEYGINMAKVTAILFLCDFFLPSFQVNDICSKVQSLPQNDMQSSPKGNNGQQNLNGLKKVTNFVGNTEELDLNDLNCSQVRNILKSLLAMLIEIQVSNL